MKNISEIHFLRRLVIPALKRLNLGDITLRHHWTGDRITLHAFTHKGYWYYGKKREMTTMMRLADLVRKEDFVVDIGGHIGYVSLYLAQLVGPRGHVVVFEPGPNNLPYIRTNTLSHTCISLVEQAVTDHGGSAAFYVENLTGQNNSLLENYRAVAANKRSAYVNSIEESCVEVPCTTLDDYLQQQRLPAPAFVKIDVEGAELAVLNGMKHTLRQSNVALMVEVTENGAAVLSLLKDAGFHLFHPNKSPVNDLTALKGNIFCVKGDDDRMHIF